MVPANCGAIGEMSAEGLDVALYCGRMRSYKLSGATFIAYDDGVKPERMPAISEGQRLRRQMAVMSFSKSSSSHHMLMRMLVPTPRLTPEATPWTSTGAAAELLDSLRAIPLEAGSEVPPPGTNLLKLVPPQLDKDLGTLTNAFAGRALCASNKNVQLVDVSQPDEAALQVGKLRHKEFNLDFTGCISPFQAFAAALAVFDQSSVRRRF